MLFVFISILQIAGEKLEMSSLCEVAIALGGVACFVFEGGAEVLHIAIATTKSHLFDALVGVGEHIHCLAHTNLLNELYGG